MRSAWLIVVLGSVAACGVFTGSEGDDQGDGCPIVICDPATTVEVEEDGMIVCEGIPAAVDCDEQLLCPAPSGGLFSVCGRVHDTETSIGTGDSIEVRIVDFVALATGGAPEPLDVVAVDSCGRFVAVDVPPPTSSFAAVVTDDAGGDDRHVPTLIAIPVAGSDLIEGARGFATRADSVADWDAAAGRSGPTSFAVVGAYLPIFLDPAFSTPPFTGRPTPGVRITEANNVFPDKDVYFASDEPLLRASIDPAQDATGASGAGLMVDTLLAIHSGTGGEPPGCNWPSELGASIAGAIMVHEHIAACR